MTPARFNIEKTILERNFPQRYKFHHIHQPGRECLELELKISTGNTYCLEMLIPDDYPDRFPLVFIRYPQPLRGYNGENLVFKSPSHELHLLAPRRQQVQLCHYKPENWHPNVTLYKVALKCLIWLEAFQNHLRTGKPLTYYLGA